MTGDLGFVGSAATGFAFAPWFAWPVASGK